MKQSIVMDLNDHRCAVCGHGGALALHHVLHGTANRRQADKYGLMVWLCPSCHQQLHDSPDPKWRAIDLELKADAQRKFEDISGHEKWMEIFRKDYLAAWEDSNGADRSSTV